MEYKKRSRTTWTNGTTSFFRDVWEDFKQILQPIQLYHKLSINTNLI